MRILSDAARRQLRSALDRTLLGEGGWAFVEAVTAQRTYPLGEGTTRDAATEEHVADKVVRLITWGDRDDEAMSRAADVLASDPALLAAFFQNLDLLPIDGPSPVSEIALLVGAALQRLADTLPDAPSGR